MTQNNINLGGNSLPIPPAPWGVEIECFPGDGVPRESVEFRAALSTQYRATADEVGVETTLPRHRRATAWVAKYDGSLSNSGREYASPILSGVEGALAAYAACQVLTGSRITRACGLHISVSIPAAVTEKRRFALVVAKAWKSIEGKVLCSMSPSRRENNYARSIQNLNENQLLTQKYYAIRLNQYSSGRIEFRCHAGTVDATKILNWANFCCRFINNAHKVFLGAGVAGESSDKIAQALAKKVLKRHKVVLEKLRDHGVFNFGDLAAMGTYGGKNINGVMRRIARGLSRRGVEATFHPSVNRLSVKRVAQPESLPPRLRAVLDFANRNFTGDAASLGSRAVENIVNRVTPASRRRQMNRLSRMLTKHGIPHHNNTRATTITLNNSDGVAVAEGDMDAVAINPENYGEAAAWMAQREALFSQGGSQ